MQAQLARQLSRGNFMAPGGSEKYRNSYLDGSWDDRREGVASTAGRPGHLWGQGMPKLLLTVTLPWPEANSPLRWPSARSQGPCCSGMWLLCIVLEDFFGFLLKIKLLSLIINVHI